MPGVIEDMGVGAARLVGVADFARAVGVDEIGGRSSSKASLSIFASVSGPPISSANPAMSCETPKVPCQSLASTQRPDSRFFSGSKYFFQPSIQDR